MPEIQHACRNRPKIRDVEKLIKLYEEGYSTLEIAKMFGVTSQAVWQRLKALGKTRSRKEAQKLRALKKLKSVSRI